MSNQNTLKAILKKADPALNSSYHERKVALEKAHKMMDETGMSFASAGFSVEDARRIEDQFSVVAPSKPKAEQRETRVSIFSRSGEIAVSDHPHYKPQPQRKKTIAQVPNFEEENERRQREEWDKKYSDWEKWRHAENISQVKSEESARRFLRNAILSFVSITLIVAFILLSQNAAIISAVVLIAKILGAIFVVFMAYFSFVILK